MCSYTTFRRRSGGRWGCLPGSWAVARHVPEDWLADRTRCRAAGVPDAVSFQTKPDQPSRTRPEEGCNGPKRRGSGPTGSLAMRRCGVRQRSAVARCAGSLALGLCLGHPHHRAGAPGRGRRPERTACRRGRRGLAGGGVAPDERRRGHQGAALVRLGGGAAGRSHGNHRQPRAPGPARDRRSERPSALPGVQHPGDDAGRHGSGGRAALDHRGWVRGRQGRSRSGSLRGAPVARVVSTHHPGSAGLCRPRGDPGADGADVGRNSRVTS